MPTAHSARSCSARSVPSTACCPRAYSRAPHEISLNEPDERSSISKTRNFPGALLKRMATPRVPRATQRRAVRGGAARTRKVGGAGPDAATAAEATRGQPQVALEDVRTRIDAVDEQIHRLLNERAQLAQQV